MVPTGAVNDGQPRPREEATPSTGAISSVVGATMNDKDKVASGRPPGPLLGLDLPLDTGSTSASDASHGWRTRSSDDKEEGDDRVFTKRDYSPPPSTWYPQMSQVLSDVSAIVEQQDVSLLVDASDLFLCPVRDPGTPRDDDEGDTTPASQQAGVHHAKSGDGGKAQATGGSPRSPVPDEADVRRLLDNEHLRMSHAPRADAVLKSVDDVHGVSADSDVTAAKPARSGSSADDVVIFSPELEPMRRGKGGLAEQVDNVVSRGRPSTRPKWRQGVRRDYSTNIARTGLIPADLQRNRLSDSSSVRGPSFRTSRQTSFDLPLPLSIPAANEDTRSLPSSPGGGRADNGAELIDLPALSLAPQPKGAVRNIPTATAEGERVVRAHGFPTRHSFVIPRPPSERSLRYNASPHSGVAPGVVERLGTRSDEAATHSYYRLVWPGHELVSNDSNGTPISQILSLSAFLDVTVSSTSDGRDMVVTLSLRTLNFAVDGQLMEQTSRGSVLGYYFDRVRIQATANEPSILVLDSTWPRASSRSIEVQRESGTSTSIEYGVNAGVEGPSPVASVSATTGRGQNFNEISSLTRPNWTWSSAVVSSAARWTWDMSTWADGSLYANDGASLRGDAWPLLHPELVGEASIAPAWQQVRSRWRVHRASSNCSGVGGVHSRAWPRAERDHYDAAERTPAAGAGGPVVPSSWDPQLSPFPRHVSLTLTMEPRVRLRRRDRRRLRRPFSFRHRTLVQEWPPRTDTAEAGAKFLLRVDLPREVAGSSERGAGANISPYHARGKSQES